MVNKTFALIGASGYIAPRHVQGIQHVRGNLVALLDPYDGIGYIDKFYPNAAFFKESERFDRHLDRLRRKGQGVDYVSICSPNYLHDSHIRLALRNGCDVICEKPLVLMHEHLEGLREVERETGKRINTILQLRHHPTIIALREKYKNTTAVHKVTLNYTTPRGVWYDYSWKGDDDKSGGINSNIGVHFFDMLMWIFGPLQDYKVDNKRRSSSGTLLLKNAEVKYSLSVEREDLPWSEWKPFRSIMVDGSEVEFSEGFTELHNVSYEHITNKQGFTLDDVEPAIKLIESIRTA